MAGFINPFLLTLSFHVFPFASPEKRKAKVFWRFQGVKRENWEEKNQRWKFLLWWKFSPHSVYDFSREIFSYSIYWSNFIVWLSSWDIIWVLIMYLLSSLWCHKFWIWPLLSFEAISLHDQKIQDKNLNILRTNRTYSMK